MDLLASGEQIAVSMLGLALQARGIAALTANQCGIHTDGSFNKARVQAVETARLVQARAPAASSSSPASRA